MTLDANGERMPLAIMFDVDGCAGARLAHLSAAREQLFDVVCHLQVGTHLRTLVSLRRAIVHPPALTYLDRLSRDSGRFHA